MYPGSRQELGRGCRNGSCCSSWSVHSSTESYRRKTTEFSPSHTHLCYLSPSSLSLSIRLTVSLLLSLIHLITLSLNPHTPTGSGSLHPYLMSVSQSHLYICACIPVLFSSCVSYPYTHNLHDCAR